MAKKYVIKKRASLLGRLRELPFDVKMILRVTIAVCVGLVIFTLVNTLSGPTPSEVKANREVLLTTDGEWETFSKYGLDVWMPTELAVEDVGSDARSYEKRRGIRDKGHFPELIYGVIVVPNEDDRTFDLQADPAGVMDVVRPMLNDALGRSMNGAYPSMVTDISGTTLASGEYVLCGEGEAIARVVYQDPKDATNKWAEDTKTNLYFNVAVFNGRAVVVWGTWDYSTYLGEEKTRAAVTDGVVSLMRSGKAEKSSTE